MEIGECGYCRIKRQNPEFHCPIHDTNKYLFKLSKTITKDDFLATTPGIFVGTYGYPHVNVGIMSPGRQDEDAARFDDPRGWAGQDMTIPNIIDLRSDLINSRFNVNIKAKPKLLDIGQEVALSSNPVDVEFFIKEKPNFRMKLDYYNAPMGPTANLNNARMTENPKISTKVDKVNSDSDLKANSAMHYLYDKGFDEHFLTRLLSAGTVGVKTQRKLVPTRWSITAVDDSVFKHIHSQIQKYNHIDHALYFGGYLGNYYLILFFPDVWSYELFETYVPEGTKDTAKLHSTTDIEFFDSRKDYAKNTVGGYYAARLAIAEKLATVKKQGACLCLRFITNEYAVPLGVWVVREATRKSLMSKPIHFSSKELMLKYAQELMINKFGLSISSLLAKSKLLKHLKSQSKLTSFMN